MKLALKNCFVLSLLLTLLILLIPESVKGQTIKQIKGTVISASTKEPLIGASVIAKGGKIGTITDTDGKFSISVSENSLLVISYLGYKKKEIKITTKSVLSIELEDNTALLDEVVAIGYSTMKRRDLTGAVSSITSEDIKRSAPTTLDQALQGKAAGVMVTQNTGQPGGSVSIRIRGVNTLNSSNEPLYVIDGIPMEGYSGNNGNALSGINPSDITSMDILKDASATAIYGSRAANGVIMITTKRGEKGKTKVNYEGYYALQRLPVHLEMMNLREYAKFTVEKSAYTGVGDRPEFHDLSALGNGTDWQSELFRVAPTQSHQLSISNGTDKTQFLFSLGYFSQEGIARGSDFNRISARLNLDNQTNKWLKTGVNVSLSMTKQNLSFTDNGLINLLLNQTPEVPAKMPDGSYGGPSDNNFPISNPLGEAELRDNISKNATVQGNIFADITFSKGLVFRTEFGGTLNFSNAYKFNPTYTMGAFTNLVNDSYRSAGNSQYWIVKNYLTYNHKFADKHDFSAMIGHEATADRWESLSGSRTDFFTNDGKELDLGNAKTAKNSGSAGSHAIESYFSRLNYSYDDRYFATATIRGDGSSNFGPKSRWGYFPSFALAWKMNNESFLKDVKTIDNLKLRLGWGKVGNQNIGSYAYGSSLGIVPTQWGSGALQGRISNPYVKWEASDSYNAGLDISILKNRIQLTTDVYLKKTKDLLLQPPFPSYVGTDSWTGEGGVIAPWVNIGGLENKGIEFTLNTVNIENKKFQWRSSFMISFNRNSITKLNQENSIIDGLIGSELITRTVVGESVGKFYGYKCIGMFTKESDFYQKDGKGNILSDANGNKKLVAMPTKAGGEAIPVSPSGIWYGDYIFEDINKDGKIDEKDRTFIGDPEPKFQYSINNTFSYKNFDLSIFLNGVYGNQIYNRLLNTHDDPINNRSALKSLTNYAKLGMLNPTGSNSDISNVYVINSGTKVARISKDAQNSNQRMSDRYIENGSYLRIKNIALGYTFSNGWTKKMDLQSLRLYVNMQNIFTFTKYTGYDPEIGSIRQNMLLSAIDDGRYPQQQMVTFGINVNF
jgi:TonB-dependent starch-binding outer membrane protein SusC